MVFKLTSSTEVIVAWMLVSFPIGMETGSFGTFNLRCLQSMKHEACRCPGVILGLGAMKFGTVCVDVAQMIAD